MPAGTPFVTWNPPGALAWSSDVILTCGPSVFSDPPLLSEVNAAYGINQLNAECNRRWVDNTIYQNINPWTKLAYIAPDTLFTLNEMAGIKNATGLIRGNELQNTFGLYPGVSGAGLVTNLPISADVLAGLTFYRKLLETDKYMAYHRIGDINFMGAKLDGTVLVNTIASLIVPIGISTRPGPTAAFPFISINALMRRGRCFVNFTIPNLGYGLATVKLFIPVPYTCSAGSGPTITTCNLEIWKSAQLSYPNNANWATSDTIFGTPANLMATVTLTPSSVINTLFEITLTGPFVQGTAYTLIIVTKEERQLSYGTLSPNQGDSYINGGNFPPQQVVTGSRLELYN